MALFVFAFLSFGSSKALAVQCEGGTCNDNSTYGEDCDAYTFGSCSDRANAACLGKGGPKSGGGIKTNCPGSGGGTNTSLCYSGSPTASICYDQAPGTYRSTGNCTCQISTGLTTNGQYHCGCVSNAPATTCSSTTGDSMCLGKAVGTTVVNPSNNVSYKCVVSAGTTNVCRYSVLNNPPKNLISCSETCNTGSTLDGCYCPSGCVNSGRLLSNGQSCGGTAPTSGGGTGGYTPGLPSGPGGSGSIGDGTKTCQDNNNNRDQDYVLVCQCTDGTCSYKTDGQSGGSGWVCDEQCIKVHKNDLSKITLSQCSQIDYIHAGGEAYCGVHTINCAGSCQAGGGGGGTTPTPSTAVTGFPVPACGTACTDEKSCDAAVVYLVPKATNATLIYAVLDKVVVGSTTLQENSPEIRYSGNWPSYGPVAGYIDGATTVKYAATAANTWIGFLVNGPSFTVHTDKANNRGGFDVYINGVKVAVPQLDNLYQATISGHSVTINVPGYDANKYACTSVGTGKACRLTSNPSSATCTPTVATSAPLACYGVSRDNQNPTKGSSVTYTMTPVPTTVLNGRTVTYEGRCTYSAQVGATEGTTGVINLVPASTGASKFQPFQVQFDRANYSCSFRYCLSDGQCIPWGTATGTAVSGTPVGDPQTNPTTPPRTSGTPAPCPTAPTCPAGQRAVEGIKPAVPGACGPWSCVAI